MKKTITFCIFQFALCMLNYSITNAQTAYITNWGDSTVSVINVATNAVKATIKVGEDPSGVSVSPDGSKVYVTNYGSRSVSEIFTASNIVFATITVGNFPNGIAVTPDGSIVYVTNYYDNTLSVINTASNTVTATIPVGTGTRRCSCEP